MNDKTHNETHIAPFERTDWERLYALFLETFNAAPWNESWTLDTARRALEPHLLHPMVFAFGCWQGASLVGAILGRLEQRDTFVQAQIVEFFVYPDAQKKGIGTALLEHTEGFFAEQQVGSVYLLTAKGLPAEEFYRARGYRQANRLIVMVKP
jgi:aminoglycoside 6'-N-acetyltransferase I